MKNFIFQNPTKLVFGKGQISKLADLIPADRRVMVTYGGGSVKKNGVYDEIVEALKGHNYIEFWGIEPNPAIETLRKAVALGKEKSIDFILSVGGGSVLDGTKLIAAAIPYEGDPWEIVLKGYATASIPFASVMTLPATGSEMNSGAVISRYETKEKYSFYNRYPEFSILDPETTFSLPLNQLANGLADTYVHVMEQYMTTPGQSRLMDRWAEGIMLSLLEIAPLVMKNQCSYDTMADFMLCATMGLNDFIRMGVTQDWATHMIGHEVTALTGIAHGASLAIILPGTLKVLKRQKWDKLLQYSERVFGITEKKEEECVDLAIEKTIDFFRSLGLATSLSEAGIDDKIIDIIVDRFNKSGVAYGENQNVTGDVAGEILLSCK